MYSDNKTHEKPTQPLILLAGPANHALPAIMMVLVHDVPCFNRDCCCELRMLLVVSLASCRYCWSFRDDGGRLLAVVFVEMSSSVCGGQGARRTPNKQTPVISTSHFKSLSDSPLSSSFFVFCFSTRSHKSFSQSSMFHECANPPLLTILPANTCDLYSRRH